MSLRLVPLTCAEARDGVTRWHRHHAAPAGDLFRVGVATSDGLLVGVGIAGRPVARAFDNGDTVEVTRIATDGTPNACSMLYAALTRAAWALGYRRVITYTQDGESGSSLKASGWRIIAQRPARSGWDTPSRPRDDAKYEVAQRTLWEAS